MTASALQIRLVTKDDSHEAAMQHSTLMIRSLSLHVTALNLASETRCSQLTGSVDETVNHLLACRWKHDVMLTDIC